MSMKATSRYEDERAAARSRPVYARAMEILKRQDQLHAEIEALEAELVKLNELDGRAWTVALSDSS
jgi:hypothetical protein